MSGMYALAAIRRQAALRVTFLSLRTNMRTLVFRAARPLCELVLLLLLFAPAVAQEPTTATPPTAEERLAKVETDVKDAALAGHNAWMLTSSALVLFMTALVLSMFFSDLARTKHVLRV